MSRITIIELIGKGSPFEVNVFAFVVSIHCSSSVFQVVFLSVSCKCLHPSHAKFSRHAGSTQPDRAGMFTSVMQGRDQASTPVPQRLHNASLLFSKTQSHGLMALRRKNLVCFYCNKRSDIKYDGFIKQWECRQCDSVNFLDEVWLYSFELDTRLILHSMAISLIPQLLPILPLPST